MTSAERVATTLKKREREGGGGNVRGAIEGYEKPTDCYPSREAAMKLKELTTAL